MTRIHQRLNLEALEDRRLLATCNVVRLGDFGAGGTMGAFSRGDLRFCINHSNDNPGPDTIQFAVPGAIHLTQTLPDIKGDLTIEGPGADHLSVVKTGSGQFRAFTVAAGP